MATQQKKTGRDYPLSETPEPIAYIKSKVKTTNEDGSSFKKKVFVNPLSGNIIEKTKTKSADGVVTKDRKIIGKSSQY